MTRYLPSRKKYYQDFYDWYLRHYYKRAATPNSSSITFSENTVASGFASGTWLNLNGTFSSASNTTVVMKIKPSGFAKYSDIFGYSASNQPVGFNASGQLGSYAGTSNSWSFGSYTYSAGTTYWIKIVYTSSSQTIYSIVDNGYTLDTLPELGSWVTSFSRTNVNSSTVSGSLRFGNGPTTTTEYFRGSIDLSGCAIYQNDVLVWQGIEESTTEPENYDWTETELVANNARTYSGDYTSKVLSSQVQVESTSEDYDSVKTVHCPLRRPDKIDYYLTTYFKRYVQTVGNPVADKNIVSGFSTSSFFAIPNAFTPGSNTWEMVFKFNLDDVSGQNGIVTSIASSVNATTYNWGLKCAYGISVAVLDGKLACWLSSTGTSWNIANPVSSEKTISAHQDYWVKVTFTGSAYNFYLSTTGEFSGEEVLHLSIASTAAIYPRFLCIGATGEDIDIGTFKGSIDLNGCHIKVGSTVWWKFIKQKTTGLFNATNLQQFGNPRKVGLLDNIAGGFSASNYYRMFDRFVPDNYPWEQVWCVRTGTDVSTRQHFQCVYNIPEDGKGVTVALQDSALQYLFAVSPNVWYQTGYGAAIIQPDTKYYIKMLWDGTHYKLQLSSDGESYTDYVSFAVSTPIVPNLYPDFVGSLSTGASWLGFIYFDECYWKINGKITWRGSRPYADWQVTVPSTEDNYNKIVNTPRYYVLNRLKPCTLTIEPTPSDATVTLLAESYTQSGNSITVLEGTEVFYKVEAENYVTQRNSIKVLKHTELPIELNNEYVADQVVFESSVGGEYQLELVDSGTFEVTVVGAGGPAALKYVYDDRGYLATGGGGAAYIGQFALEAGTYTINVGAISQNSTMNANPSDQTPHGSSISGVVSVGGGYAGIMTTSAGAGGSAPVLSLTAVSETLNSAGNNGSGGSGGKGSGANYTANGGASLYGGYGLGQGGSTSEYVARCYWINGTNGYVKVVYKGE